MKEFHPTINSGDMERAVTEILANLDELRIAAYKARNRKTIDGLKGRLFSIRKVS